MKKSTHRFLSVLDWMSRLHGLSLIVAIAAPILLLIIVFSLLKGTSVGIEQNDRISVTPTQIRAIEEIGEWEFLSISDEELIDTVSYGFFGDSELVRIYYGTLRLGINLREAKPGWIKVEKDSIAVRLPSVRLLDQDFIDEARTVSFFESGTWTGQDRENLYQRAYQAMLRRCLTRQNINTAEQNARNQFHKLMLSMGYKKVNIQVEKPSIGIPKRPN